MGTADAAFPSHVLAETSLSSLSYPVGWLPLGVVREDRFVMAGRPAQVVGGASETSRSSDATRRPGLDAADSYCRHPDLERHCSAFVEDEHDQLANHEGE